MNTSRTTGHNHRKAKGSRANSINSGTQHEVEALWARSHNKSRCEAAVACPNSLSATKDQAFWMPLRDEPGGKLDEGAVGTCFSPGCMAWNRSPCHNQSRISNKAELKFSKLKPQIPPLQLPSQRHAKGPESCLGSSRRSTHGRVQDRPVGRSGLRLSPLKEEKNGHTQPVKRTNQARTRASNSTSEPNNPSFCWPFSLAMIGGLDREKQAVLTRR